MEQNPEIITFKTYCHRCSGYTNHKILNEISRYYNPTNTPDMGIDFAEGSWQIIECLGCESISFRLYWSTSEDDYDESGPTGTEFRYPQVGADKLIEEQYTSLPHNIRMLYHEIVESYNQRLFIACAGLIRTIIEAIGTECATLFSLPEILKNPKGKGQVEWKVECLVSKGILSINQGKILQESRFLGNKALHELKIPSDVELRELFRIIEHILYSVFDMSEKLIELQWRRNRKKN